MCAPIFNCDCTQYVAVIMCKYTVGDSNSKRAQVWQWARSRIANSQLTIPARSKSLLLAPGFGWLEQQIVFYCNPTKMVIVLDYCCNLFLILRQMLILKDYQSLFFFVWHRQTAPIVTVLWSAKAEFRTMTFSTLISQW